VKIRAWPFETDGVACIGRATDQAWQVGDVNIWPSFQHTRSIQGLHICSCTTNWTAGLPCLGMKCLIRANRRGTFASLYSACHGTNVHVTVLTFVLTCRFPPVRYITVGFLEKPRKPGATQNTLIGTQKPPSFTERKTVSADAPLHQLSQERTTFCRRYHRWRQAGSVTRETACGRTESYFEGHIGEFQHLRGISCF
jgi:hypothetical protein